MKITDLILNAYESSPWDATLGAAVIQKPRNEWEELADAIAANDRPHAGHFSWESDRSLEERGVLDELAEALRNAGSLFFTNPRHRGSGNDPPDCEADGLDGRLIGFELTELVDPQSAAAARAGKHYEERDWRASLISELEQILAKKDRGSPRGGPYSEYVLVVYSDEPWIEIDRVRRDLGSYIFAPTNLITKAFLLLSYSPFEKGYPCIPLQIGGT
jgi:hypothetical protein